MRYLCSAAPAIRYDFAKLQNNAKVDNLDIEVPEAFARFQ